MLKKRSGNRCPDGKCHCRDRNSGARFSGIKKTTKTLPSVLLSFFIAFFPKCPFCWAIYMSMFTSIGLAKLPYMKWLLPVLLVFLGIHLFMLYRRAPRVGYLPFIISVAGSSLLFLSRTFLPDQTWILIMGIACIFSGSLLNGFADIRNNFKTNPL